MNTRISKTLLLGALASGLTYIVLVSLFWAITLGATYADLPLAWFLFGIVGSLIGAGAGWILLAFRSSSQSITVVTLAVIGALASVFVGAFAAVYGSAIAEVSDIPPVQFRTLALVGLVVSGILAEFLIVAIVTTFTKFLHIVRK